MLWNRSRAYSRTQKPSDREALINSTHTRQGISFIVIGLIIAALNGAFMKLLTQDLSVFQITWFRFFGFALIMLPIVLHRFGRSALRPARPGIQFFRGLSMATGTIAFVAGVQTVDFADSIAILYAYPFLLILLAVMFLGERVQRIVWVGVVGGFLGVLLVMRPEFRTINMGTLYVFLSALIVSIQMALNSKLGNLSHPLITSFWGAVIATCVLFFFLPFYWQPVSADLLWLIGLMIICGASSQTLIVYSFTKATASTLAPFTYFEIISAVAIGYFMFGTLPVWMSWVGILLITVSGLMVARSLPGRNSPQRQAKI
jgi:drug/metabolite transporter (DMT)-like permease